MRKFCQSTDLTACSGKAVLICPSQPTSGHGVAQTRFGPKHLMVGSL